MTQEAIWNIALPYPGLHDIARRLALSVSAAQVLLNRGGEAMATQETLEPKLQQLLDPSTLSDIDVAVDVLAKAIHQRDPICIYGDYDVDGTTSAALMVENLRLLGGNVGFYLPHRLLQGYGLHQEAVDEIFRNGYKLLVTCDLGISNAQEVAYAKALGLEVIVVDHHQVPEQLPAADAVINPHRSDDRFAFKFLCAAGVCFHLLIALRRHLRANLPESVDLKRCLDLVAVATVADMVPLVGLNRILVARGLEVIRSGQRPGLAALLRVCGVDPLQVDARDIAFRIGPRINAAGRIGCAMRCVELFLAEDVVAVDLATRLNQENQVRKGIEDTVFKQALAQGSALLSQKQTLGLVVYDEYWHPGVIGIVASRLVERFHRPTIVIGQGGKGSARSIQGINVLQAIEKASAHLVKFGGHAYAAGITLKNGEVEAFREAFVAGLGASMTGEHLKPQLPIDALLTAESLTFDLINDLKRVGPYGSGFAEPLFALSGVVVNKRSVVGNDHLKLQLNNGLSAIGFRMAGHALAQYDHLDLAFTPFVSEFGGQRRVELRLKDIRAAQASSQALQAWRVAAV